MLRPHIAADSSEGPKGRPHMPLTGGSELHHCLTRCADSCQRNRERKHPS